MTYFFCHLDVSLPPFFSQQFVKRFDFWILLQVEGDGATFGSY